MAGAILIPAILPWLDRSRVRSIRHKGALSKWMLAIFVVSFLVLGYLGTIPASTPRHHGGPDLHAALLLRTFCSCPGIRVSSAPNRYRNG